MRVNFPYPMRHAWSTALAVLLAVILSRFVLNDGQSWMVLAAFLTVGAARGTPFRQGILLIITMLAAVVVSFILIMNLGLFGAVCVAIFIFTCSACMLFMQEPFANAAIFRALLFPLILLVMVFFTSRITAWSDQLIQIIAGVALGVICHYVFPVRFEQDFRQGLVPVLTASMQYVNAIVNCFTQQETNEQMLAGKKWALEQSLQAQSSLYPEWVYEVGFNPGLRAGFRFYLVNVERMTEIFFSMNYLAMRGVALDVLQPVSTFILSATQQNTALINVILDYVEHGRIQEMTGNFTDDIAQLESAVNQVVPAHLDLLDISPDYITLVAFVRDVKDLRRLLLQLVMALSHA